MGAGRRKRGPMKYLLDTNICIFLLKNSFPSMTERMLMLDPDDFAISSITLSELEYGASKSKWGERTRDNLYAFLAPFTVLPFDSNDAIAAGRIRALLESQGTPIGAYDVQIAAQAYMRELSVITHNADEFSRVPGLKVEDWVLLS